MLVSATAAFHRPMCALQFDCIESELRQTFESSWRETEKLSVRPELPSLAPRPPPSDWCIGFVDGGGRCPIVIGDHCVRSMSRCVTNKAAPDSGDLLRKQNIGYFDENTPLWAYISFISYVVLSCYGGFHFVRRKLERKWGENDRYTLVFSRQLNYNDRHRENGIYDVKFINNEEHFLLELVVAARIQFLSGT